MTKLKTHELQLGDSVRMAHLPPSEKAAYTVKQVTPEQVFLWRPYTIVADFSYTGGVMVSIGVEDFTVERNNDRIVWDLYKRVELK